MPDKPEIKDLTLRRLEAEEDEARANYYKACNDKDPAMAEYENKLKEARARCEQYKKTRGNGKASEQKSTPHEGTADTSNQKESSLSEIDKRAPQGGVAAPTSVTSSPEISQDVRIVPEADSQAEFWEEIKAKIRRHEKITWMAIPPKDVQEVYKEVYGPRQQEDLADASEPENEQESGTKKDVGSLPEEPESDEPIDGKNHELMNPDGSSLKMAGVSDLRQVVRDVDDIVSVKITNYKEGKVNVRTVDRLGGWQLGTLYRSLILPTRLYHFHTTRKLFKSILSLFEEHVMLPKNECSLLAYWSMMTWFTDYLPFVPCLVTSGPSARADVLLRTLGAVCQTPLLLAGLSPLILRKLNLNELGPATLLLREPQVTPRMTALLNASNQPGYWFFNGERFQPLYCPKCIYIGDTTKRQSMASNSIQLHLGGGPFRPLHLDPKDDAVVDLQNQLLYYRLLNHDKVAASGFRVSAFRPEMCSVAEVLGAAICDDPDLQHGVIDVLKNRDEQSRADQASGLDGVVVRAVLFHAHQNGRQEVFVREIADTVNRIHKEEGEPLKVSSEKVGHVLKQLGLYSRRLGSTGRGLRFDKSTQGESHKLAQAYDVLAFEAGCQYCHELQDPKSVEVEKDV